MLVTLAPAASQATRVVGAAGQGTRSGYVANTLGAVTRGDWPAEAHDPVNPYRSTADRLDSGSGSLTLGNGLRRYSPDFQRFWQRDLFPQPGLNVALSLSPLSNNRYALAAGTPLNFVEVGGHAMAPDETGGGGAVDPAPAPVPTFPTDPVPPLPGDAPPVGDLPDPNGLGNSMPPGTAAAGADQSGANCQLPTDSLNCIGFLPGPGAEGTLVLNPAPVKDMCAVGLCAAEGEAGALASKAEETRASGAGASADYVEFAHGTTQTSGQDIATNGLSQDASLQNLVGSNQPGSFYTVKIDPSNPYEALSTAASWGTRHGGEPAVVVLRLPRSVVEELEESGSLIHRDIPQESIFKPEAFDTVNTNAQWQYIPLPKPAG